MGLHPDFPLFPHQTGHWAKKVRGKLYYFGKVSADPKGQAALLEWDRVKEARLAGREPRPKVEGVTVGELCDRFLQAKDQLLSEGQITKRTWDDYKRVTDRIVAKFGSGRVVVDLTTEDFAALRASIAKTYGPVSLGNEIQRCRVVFKYGIDEGLIDRPMRYGQLFKRPSKKVLRVAKAEKGSKMIEAVDLKRLIEAADVKLKAMIYLGLNAGFGNSDCGTLPLKALDLKAGFVMYHRPKTGINRRCPLWPETVEALNAVLGKRKPPKDSDVAELVFVTKYGQAWAKDEADSPITKQFRKLLNKLKLHKPGIGFYSLRHVFRTVAAGAKDLEATRCIMGHTSGHIEEGYIEQLPDDARLRAVTDFVRAWLYPPETQGENNKPAKPTATASLRIVG